MKKHFRPAVQTFPVADNIDINTEAIDGKNTFHSMARAVFQIRHYTVEPNSNQTKIKISQERSVQ
jgi:hypothetical protein